MKGMIMELKTCKGCYWLNNAEYGENTCYEIGKCKESLRCILYCTPQDLILRSDKVLDGVLADMEHYVART